MLAHAKSPWNGLFAAVDDDQEPNRPHDSTDFMNANFLPTNGKISWLPCTTCINENRAISTVQRAAVAAGGRTLRQFHGRFTAVVPEPERRQPAHPADRGVFRLRAFRAPYAHGR